MASLLVAAGLLWLVAARRVRAARGPAAVSWGRSALFLGGLGAVAVALASPVDAAAATWFSVHMVQHLLLALVAAPLLVLARPLTLALQASTPATRRRLVLLLHRRPLALLSSPLIAWGGFALVMWATHFSPSTTRPPWSTLPTSARRCCSGRRWPRLTRARPVCRRPPGSSICFWPCRR